MAGYFEGFDFHSQEGDDDGDEADGVDEKTYTLAGKGDEEACDGRADEAGAVEDEGVEGDCVRQVIVIIDKLADECLPGGHVEAVDCSK